MAGFSTEDLYFVTRQRIDCLAMRPSMCRTNMHARAVKNAIFLLFLSCQCCFAVTANDPVVAGEWSESVNGLRGRLLFGEDAPLNGTRVGAVYLELQNISAAGNDIQVFYDTRYSLHFELREPSDKARKDNGFRGFVLPPRWLSLPKDSSLRFRVNLDGYGNPKDAGLHLGLPGEGWIIPSSETNDFFLPATFTVNPPKERDRAIIWEGILKLPSVKIPFRKP
jgi:hypothetical protein